MAASGRVGVTLETGSPVWVRISEVQWRRAVLVQALGEGRWTVRGDESNLSRAKFEVFEDQLAYRSENEHELMSSNLIVLSDVTVPQVVNALQWRFKNQMYYVWGGDVMVNVVPPRAMPPFTPADHHKYRHVNVDDKPHIFALGAQVAEKLASGITQQSVVFLGEAGSGKSVAISHLIKHLAYLSTEKLGGARNGNSGTVALPAPASANMSGMAKIPALKTSLSNPGMGSPKWSPGKPATISSPSTSKSTPEALLGLPDRLDDAIRVLRLMTCRESNAGPRTSRAAMILHLQYRDDGCLVGARITSELVDRSCLSQPITRLAGRSFDVLHSCVHASAKYGARLDPAEEYAYLGRRGNAKDIAHDKKHWEAFAAALAALKISTYEISYLVQLMAAVLHLGNLDFIQPDTNCPPTPSDPGLFKTICTLLCLDEKLLISILYNLPDDRTYQPTNRAAINTLDEIYTNRDFFAQTIYGIVYDWIVLQVNALLSNDDACTGVITVVDIPGMLAEPTYGALCTNLLCELLHDHCVSQLIEAKLMEFREEEVEIPNITVPNRQETVDIIMAILYFVAEVPNCSNDTMATCLANLQGSQTTEVVVDYDDTGCTLRHSGGCVTYSYQSLRDCAGLSISDQWVGSLRQTGNLILRQITTQQFTTLMEREALFLQSLRQGIDGASMPNELKGIDCIKATVAKLLDPMRGVDTMLVTCYRSSPSELTQSRLPKANSLHDDTTPKGADLSADTLIPQLQDSVLIPLIKWSLVGYSEFIPHLDFLKYTLLAPDVETDGEPRYVCEDICRVCLMPDDYQVGKSVVVLKRGKAEILDSHLEACEEDAATKLQATVRGYQAKKKQGGEIKLKMWSVVKMQSAIRSYLGRKRTNSIKGEKQEAANILREQQEEQNAFEREVSEGEAAALVQRSWRGFKGRESATAKLKAVTMIQSAWRRSDTSSRIAYLRSKYLALVVTVQRHIRGYLARLRSKNEAIENQAACIIQEAYLRHLARRHTAAAQIQAWWRKMLADLAIHWVLRQFRRSVFITQFAYSSMKAKTLAQEYSKYQSSVEEINMQFGSAQKMVERDAINSKFEEQMRLGVDSAYRNGDAEEIQRMIGFANDEDLSSVVEYGTDALYRLKQSQSRGRSEGSSDYSPSPSPGGGRAAPPPPRGSPPPRKRR